MGVFGWWALMLRTSPGDRGSRPFSQGRARALPAPRQRLRAPLTARRRGQFRSAHAFIAFLELDVRVKQSGRWQGRCKLTKKGDGEVRRLLYNAAMQGRRNPQWDPYYLRQRGRGMSSTAALVALGRKLAKVSFALLPTDARFVPTIPEKACVTT
jgi:transposase